MCAQMYSPDREECIWESLENSPWQPRAGGEGLSAPRPGFNARVQEHTGNAAEVEPPVKTTRLGKKSHWCKRLKNNAAIRPAQPWTTPWAGSQRVRTGG